MASAWYRIYISLGKKGQHDFMKFCIPGLKGANPFFLFNPCALAKPIKHSSNGIPHIPNNRED